MLEGFRTKIDGGRGPFLSQPIQYIYVIMTLTSALNSHDVCTLFKYMSILSAQYKEKQHRSKIKLMICEPMNIRLTHSSQDSCTHDISTSLVSCTNNKFLMIREIIICQVYPQTNLLEQAHSYDIVLLKPLLSVKGHESLQVMIPQHLSHSISSQQILDDFSIHGSWEGDSLPVYLDQMLRDCNLQIIVLCNQ